MSAGIPRIAVVGAGAIGSSVAADLIDAGVDVLVVDQWPEHVEAMRRDGLRVVMPDREVAVSVQACHPTDLAALTAELDIAFLAVKCYDTRWMSELISMYLHADGVVVGLQNGMVNDAIAAAVGTARTVGSVVELSAEIYEPGPVQRDTPRSGTWFALGELDGAATPRVDRIADLLRHVARVGISDNITGAKWTKLVANSMTMGPFGLLGLKNWEAAALPGMFDISVRLGREALAVGQRLGHRIEPIFGLTAAEFAGSDDEVLITTMKTLLGHIGRSATTAIVQDRRKGRRTEQECITGEVVRRGRDVGVPTPASDAVMQIAHAIDRGDLPMNVDNLDRLKALLTGT
jgi:2-dehydropantoate 2-reductase